MSFKRSIAGIIFCFIGFSGVLYAERVVIPEGTSVHVRLKADLLSTRVDVGSRVDFVVARPVTVHGVVAIPAGAVAWGAVQSVKQDKVIKFDIEGVILGDRTEIKLRSLSEKSKKTSKDQLKIDSDFGDTVGAPKGTEYTAFVDEAISVEAAAATPSMPSPAPTPSPAPAEVTAPAAPTTTPVQEPTAPPPQTTGPASAAPAEPVTLICSSDPTGADIVIDGDFRGTTPSILKIPPGKHHLEYQLSGYNQYSRDLDLKSGMGVQTIQPTLQKKE